MKIKKAVILTAGFGTRFLPITKVFPKALLPIENKPIIHFLIEELIDSGIESITIVVKEADSLIKKYFNDDEILNEYLISQGKDTLLSELKQINNQVKINYVVQEKKGSGGALLAVKDLINEPFIVVFCDDLMLGQIPATKQLIDAYLENGLMQIAALEIPKDKISRYGVLTYTSEGYVDSIIEKPDQITAELKHAGIGRYLVTPDIFDYLLKADVQSNGEIYLPQTMFKMKDYGYKLNPVFVKTNYFDLGGQEGYLKANIYYGLKDNQLNPEINNFIKEEL